MIKRATRLFAAGVSVCAAAARAQQAPSEVPLPAGAPSAWTWVFGGEARMRYEAFENDVWGGGVEPDHDYTWWRATPYVEVHRDASFRALAQLIVAFEDGDEAGISPVDEDRGDVLQAFVEAGPPDIVGALTPQLWLGRRVLAYGSERLISTRLGPNVPRAFDVVGLTLAAKRRTVDLFWSRPVTVEDGAFDDTADESRSLWSAYATWDVAERVGLDLYGIGYTDELASYEQGSGRERRRTFGLRSFGYQDTWDWNVEVFGQIGSFAGGDVRAWSVATDVGCALDFASRGTRLGLRANAISGDSDPADEDLGTFQAMFPKGKYFGEIGLIGPANLLNVHPSLEVPLSPQWTATLAAVLYWRESTGDGVYGVAGQLLEPGAGSDERYIGTQIDVGVEYAPRSWFGASVGLSALFPGAFLDDRGFDEPVLFAGFELRFVVPGGD